MTIEQALDAARQAGLDRLDAQLLLLQALGLGSDRRAWLIAHDTDSLGNETQTRFLAMVARRKDNEPLAYITGTKEFYGLTLKVDANVLVPRPETETLVDWALEQLLPTPCGRVLDLGTGSGAVALAIKHTRPDLEVHALDTSEPALTVAQGNAHSLGLDIRFHVSHWLTRAPTGLFDVIASNPPYVAAGDDHLGALRHEPLSALVAAEHGLSDLRAIIASAPAHLAKGGWLLLEHGYDQASLVRNLLMTAGFAQVQTRKDLAGLARCSGGQWLPVGEIIDPTVRPNGRFH